MNTPQFTHLHVHSHYSLLDGLTKIPELVKHTKKLGMNAVALTDHGVLYGAVEFYKEAKKHNIKPIIGIELYLTPGDHQKKRPKVDDVRYHLTVLAKNNTGYRNLIALTTKAHLDGFYYKPRVDKTLLKEYSEGLVCLSGCMQGELSQTLLAGNKKKAYALAEEYRDIFGKENYFIEIWHHPNVPRSKEAKDALIQLAKDVDIPLVATHDSHYLTPDDSTAQDILVAVQTGAHTAEDNRMSMREHDLSLVSPEKMHEYFKDTPEALENTMRIAEMCTVELSLGEIQLPHFEVPKGKSDTEYLRELCEKGMHRHYPDGVPDEVKERLSYELGVIAKTGFATYFLIVQDFVRWAKEQEIVVGPGRGSVAGSITAFFLGITTIDPLKYDLLFERFLNPERISMPDIDLDFADTRRDEVLDYVKDTYGTDHVAQIITFGTMAARAAIRDTGRAMGLSYGLCDKIAKMIPFGMKLAQALEGVDELRQLYDTDVQVKELLDAAQRLEGVVRHASTHACGVVITKDPLTNHVPLQRASRNDETVVTQYEMHSVEDLGLLKMDFLGLKNLTIIEEALKSIRNRHGKDIAIETIPLDDKKTFELLQRGETTGVFQLESGGMRRNLKELKPTEFEDIIVMVSLYRPGPMDLIPTYIRRKHGQEQVSYLHPKLEPILKNTYGIGVYQEQMMRIARDCAGFTLAEADILRKAIGKKIKKLLDEQKEKLISGMRENGIEQHIAEDIWELFPPFALYGFNRSHAACYAMIAYQTAYLKAHYPTDFTKALLNADSGDVERIAFLANDGQDLGISVLPPDVNESTASFTITSTKTIRFGLSAIKNVGSAIAQAIVDEREDNGPFETIEDFLQRIDTKDLNKKSLEALIKAGALDSLGERGQLLANLENILAFAKESRKAREAGQASIFDTGDAVAAIPAITLKPAKEATKKDTLAWEKELLGLYITDHPLSAVREVLKEKTHPVKDLSPTHKKISVGGILTRTKRIVTKNGKPMVFAELEDLSGRVEVVVFPTILAKNMDIWQEDAVLLVTGRVERRDNAIKVICDEVQSLETV